MGSVYRKVSVRPVPKKSSQGHAIQSRDEKSALPWRRCSKLSSLDDLRAYPQIPSRSWHAQFGTRRRSAQRVRKIRSHAGSKCGIVEAQSKTASLRSRESRSKCGFPPQRFSPPGTLAEASFASFYRDSGQALKGLARRRLSRSRSRAGLRSHPEVRSGAMRRRGTEWE
jgi:hypothetical protein